MKEKIKVDDIVIAMIDEWGNGEKRSFDCTVMSVTDKGVDGLYLSGYRSRNDFIPWADIKAKVDMDQPRVSVEDFEGHFLVF